MARDVKGRDGRDVIRLRTARSDEGWERRFVTSPERAAEAEQLYREMGFDVRTERLARDELDAGCGACAEAICRSDVVIYTRKSEESRS